MDEARQKLLLQLHSPRAAVRAEATQLLWHWWYSAAGPVGARLLQEAEALMQRGANDECETALTNIIAAYPDFAEAWNRRATLRYLRRQYEASLADCHAVVQREPHHFGAWHGMGLCLMALRRYPQAADAFRRALAIQPFAEVNRELLRMCQSKLN